MSLNLAAAASTLEPDPSSKQLFRLVMGRFATGVTVITTSAPDGVYGMTANAFMAGSLEPLLCVVSIDRRAQMHARLAVGRQVGVSVLSEWQQHLSAHFAGKRLGSAAPEFTFRGATPILARAVAALVAAAEHGLSARVDIEFCFARGKLWALQCRPITTLR
jgi:flavin reductase (DIM6/NTAB) family NADH-FMN oxidoreductase RutF